MPSLKCVVVGDSEVGKTCLLQTYATNHFPDTSNPLAFQDYVVSVLVNGKHIQLNLCDTAGSSDYDLLRPLTYEATDVFLLCFSLMDPTSLEHIKTKWVPEIRLHMPPTIPLLLVGTKKDECIPVMQEIHHHHQQQMVALMKEIGALGYVECSAFTQKEELKNVFDQAIRYSL